MKIIDIIPTKLKSISDEEIETLHLRTHQIYLTVIQRRSLTLEFADLLREKHNMIIRELRIRDIEHKTPMR